MNKAGTHIVAVILTGALLADPVTVSAFSDRQNSSQLPIAIPERWGRITDAYGVSPEFRVSRSELTALPGSSNAEPGTRNPKLVILIQDLHGHPVVQRNIAEILKHLSRHASWVVRRESRTQTVGHTTHDTRLRTGNGYLTVFVEGASGPFDVSLLRNVPNPWVKKKVVDHFLNDLKLTGAEIAAIESKTPMHLWGVDDKELYLQNLEAFYKASTPPPSKQPSLVYREASDKLSSSPRKRGPSVVKTLLDSRLRHAGMTAGDRFTSDGRLDASRGTIPWSPIPHPQHPAWRDYYRIAKERDIPLALNTLNHIDLLAEGCRKTLPQPSLVKGEASDKLSSSPRKRGPSVVKTLLDSRLRHAGMTAGDRFTNDGRSYASRGTLHPAPRSPTRTTFTKSSWGTSPKHQTRGGVHEARVVALVAGGYHTDGITRILKANRIPYVVVAPRVERLGYERSYAASLRSLAEMARTKTLSRTPGFAVLGFVTSLGFLFTTEAALFVRLFPQMHPDPWVWILAAVNAAFVIGSTWFLWNLQSPFAKLRNGRRQAPSPLCNLAIQVGRVDVKDVRRAIALRILTRHAYKAWDRSGYAPGDRDLPIRVDTRPENLEALQAARKFLDAEADARLDQTDIIVLEGLPIIYLEDDLNYQAARASPRRKAFYIGEGLWNMLRGEPQALGALIAHEVYHLAHHRAEVHWDVEEAGAEKRERAIDPDGHLRQIIATTIRRYIAERGIWEDIRGLRGMNHPTILRRLAAGMAGMERDRSLEQMEEGTEDVKTKRDLFRWIPLPIRSAWNSIKSVVSQAAEEIRWLRVAMNLYGVIAAQRREMKRIARQESRINRELQAQTPQDRIAAIKQIENRKDAARLGTVQRALIYDPEAIVRQQAARTLGALQYRAALGSLESLALYDPHPLVREAALEAIRKIYWPILQGESSNLLAREAAKALGIYLVVAATGAALLRLGDIQLPWADPFLQALLWTGAFLLARAVLAGVAEWLIHGHYLRGGPNQPGLFHTRPDGTLGTDFEISPDLSPRRQRIARSLRWFLKFLLFPFALPHEILHKLLLKLLPSRWRPYAESEILVYSLEAALLVGGITYGPSLHAVVGLNLLAWIGVPAIATIATFLTFDKIKRAFLWTIRRSHWLILTMGLSFAFLWPVKQDPRTVALPLRPGRPFIGPVQRLGRAEGLPLAKVVADPTATVEKRMEAAERLLRRPDDPAAFDAFAKVAATTEPENVIVDPSKARFGTPYVIQETGKLLSMVEEGLAQSGDPRSVDFLIRAMQKAQVRVWSWRGQRGVAASFAELNGPVRALGQLKDSRAALPIFLAVARNLRVCAQQPGMLVGGTGERHFNEALWALQNIGGFRGWLFSRLLWIWWELLQSWPFRLAVLAMMASSFLCFNDGVFKQPLWRILYPVRPVQTAQPGADSEQVERSNVDELSNRPESEQPHALSPRLHPGQLYQQAGTEAEREQIATKLAPKVETRQLFLYPVLLAWAKAVALLVFSPVIYPFWALARSFSPVTVSGNALAQGPPPTPSPTSAVGVSSEVFLTRSS